MDETLSKDYCPIKPEEPIQKTSPILVILVMVLLTISSGLGYLIFANKTIIPTTVLQPTLVPTVADIAPTVIEVSPTIEASPTPEASPTAEITPEITEGLTE